MQSVEEHQHIPGRKLTETGVYFVYLGGKIEDNGGTEADTEKRLGQACYAIIIISVKDKTVTRSTKPPALVK